MRLRSGPLPGPAPAAKTIASAVPDVGRRVVVLEVAQDRRRAVRLEVGGVVGVADQPAAVVAGGGELAEEMAGDLAVPAGDEDIHADEANGRWEGVALRSMGESHRPQSFARVHNLPLVGRVADWGMGPRAVSKKTKQAGARIAGLKATESVCPYCAVGCGQVVYTREPSGDEGSARGRSELVDIEGNPRSPINQGTLCPKGSASRQLVQQPGRLTKVKYRRPGGTEWEELDLETAMDMIAERTIAAREHGWQDTDDEGRRVDRTLGFAHLGGATLDNEENYLIKKAFTAMGAIQIENQARI